MNIFKILASGERVLDKEKYPMGEGCPDSNLRRTLLASNYGTKIADLRIFLDGLSLAKN